MAQKILIVDDEEGIRQLVRDYFEIQDYEVIEADSGNAALKRIEEAPDLILLDINMPDLDGLSVCRKIRSSVECPIVFLTARIEEQDRINGFLMGGDDYVLKPFSIEELGARVMAHLRREQRRQASGTVNVVGEVAIYYEERVVRSNSVKIYLTKTEYEIVELLSLHPGQIFSKESIYEKLRGYDAEGDSAIIAEHIRRIRGKIGALTRQEVIETVWGVGYRWIG
ncbi:response regulator transcription factor [Roseburia hominis]